MTLRSLFGCTLFCAALAIPSKSFAAEPGTPTVENAVLSEAAPRAHLTGALGMLDDNEREAFIADVLALSRFDSFAVGANCQLGTGIFGNHSLSLGGSIGVFAPTPRWLELGLVGTLGARGYMGVGSGLFSNDPGASAMLGFASARAVITLAVGSGSTRFTVGLHGVVDDDLGRVTKSYSFQQVGGGWLGDERVRTENTTHTVGALKVGSLLALGATF